MEVLVLKLPRTISFQDSHTGVSAGIERPLQEVIEQRFEARPAIGCLEGMIRLVDYDVAQRTMGLLPNCLERKEVGRQRRVIPTALCHEQRHRTFPHIIEWRAV